MRIVKGRTNRAWPSWPCLKNCQNSTFSTLHVIEIFLGRWYDRSIMIPPFECLMIILIDSIVSTFGTTLISKFTFSPRIIIALCFTIVCKSSFAFFGFWSYTAKRINTIIVFVIIIIIVFVNVVTLA